MKNEISTTYIEPLFTFYWEDAYSPIMGEGFIIMLN